MFEYVPQVGPHSNKTIDVDDITSHEICMQVIENSKITHNSKSISYE